MGVGSIGGWTFRVDPNSIHWTFGVNTSVIETVGGRVVQVLGASLGDMTVVGSFGVGSWQEQQKFLAYMKHIADVQVQAGRSKGTTPPSVHFRYPPRKWDFQISLLGFTQVGAGTSVEWAPENFAPGWELRLFIEEDNSGITKIAADAYISRFSAGLGWTQTAFNGPMSQADVDATLAGQDPGTYLAANYGVALPAGGAG